MVLKTDLCRFSGLKIYPGHGMRLVRQDSTQFQFLNSKTKRLFNQRKKPSRIAWTFLYRKQHKKGIEEAGGKKARKVKRSGLTGRSIVGASLELITKKRSESGSQRKAAQEAALREVKERKKKTAAEKKDQKLAQRAQQAQAKGGRSKR